MKYLLIIVLLALIGIIGRIEFILLRKGLKTSAKSSPGLPDEAEPSLLRSLTNKYLRPKVRPSEPFPKPKKNVSEPVAMRGENVISFPEKSSKPVEFAAPKQELPAAASPLPPRETSMLDIIQEIRGESGHPPQAPHDPIQELRAADVKTPVSPANESAPEPERQPPAAKIRAFDQPPEDAAAETESSAASELPAEIDAAEERFSPEELIKSGLELVRRGHLEDGIKKIEAVVAALPEKADAHFNLGIAYTLQENLPQAINAYQRAIAIEPKYGKAFYNLGTLYLKQGNVPEAILKLEEAVKLLPDSMKALWNLYEAYRSSEVFTKALASLHKLIALEPEDASLHNHLGICYVKLGDYPRAINSWKRALTLGASSHLIHYNLGKTYELYGDLGAAREHYQQFIGLASKTTHWQELVSEVQDRLDNLEQTRLPRRT